MNLSIFLVDDDEDDRFLLSLVFSSIGLREYVTFFSNGSDLLKQLENLPAAEYPELIGLDCQMPRYNGEELLVSLKSNQQWHSIPVAMFSHHMTARLKQKLIKLGAVDCFEKTSLYVDYVELSRKLVALTIHETASVEINHL